jgi:hypothetical protein
MMTSVPVPAHEPEPPIVRPLWSLLHGNRCVVAVVRQWSYVPGLELLITLNGALRWARFYRDASELEAEAERKRQQMTQRGWTPG